LTTRNRLPEPVAAGGVLRNTGILFETDNLTNYQRLMPSGASTYGVAVGLDLLSPEFTHQLILEAAALQVLATRRCEMPPAMNTASGAISSANLEATLLRSTSCTAS